MSIRFFSPICFFVLISLACVSLGGCGKSMKNDGTEQLITSDAVDRVIGEIDFSPLAGQTVYLDDRFIKNIKGVGFVNGDYIVSSLRQQIMAAGCRLQEKQDTADYVVEARVGALGNDSNEVSYGIPSSNLLSTASSIVPAAPSVPTIPEISIAKKQMENGDAKIAVFAYHRESREAVWQSGVNTAHSNSRATWLLGMGPWQSGTIYERTRFAGTEVKQPIRDLFAGKYKEPPSPQPTVNYREPYKFPLAKKLEQEREMNEFRQGQAIEYANHEEEVKKLADEASKLSKEEKKDEK